MGNEMGNEMGDLVRGIARAIVDNPDGVSVKEVSSQNTVVYELTTDKADLGKVIGKQGRIAGAIRILLSAAGSKNNKRFILEILE